MSRRTFIVPFARASPWSSLPMSIAPPNESRINIFCDDHHVTRPWLLGSFVVSREVHESLDREFWAWEKKYRTGDGYLLGLERNASVPVDQELVGDKLRDRTTRRDALMEARQAMERGDFEKAKRLSESVEDRHLVRLRWTLECGLCKNPRVFRADRLQPVLKTLGELQVAEVRFPLLAARLDRQRGT